jgi:hypothetical protein
MIRCTSKNGRIPCGLGDIQDSGQGVQKDVRIVGGVRYFGRSSGGLPPFMYPARQKERAMKESNVQQELVEKRARQPYDGTRAAR